MLISIDEVVVVFRRNPERFPAFSFRGTLGIRVGARLPPRGPKLFYALPPRRNLRGGALTISVHTPHV